jgi:hypothetical protein
MGFLCVFICFLPVFIILAITYMNYRQTNNAFEKFAHHTGLNYSPGNYLGQIDVKPSVRGIYKGLDFELSIVNSYTRIIIKLRKECADYSLSISPYGLQNTISSVLKMTGAGNSIDDDGKTGDKDFDRLFRLEGSSALIPVFTPELRKNLIAIREWVNIKFERKSIIYEAPGIIKDSSFLIQLTEILYYMAQEIGDLSSALRRDGISKKSHKDTSEIEKKPETPETMEQINSFVMNSSGNLSFNKHLQYSHNKPQEKPYELIKSDFMHYETEQPINSSIDKKPCPFCGTLVPSDNLYCIDCGRKI